MPLFPLIPSHILPKTSSPTFQLILFLEPDPLNRPTPPPSCKKRIHLSDINTNLEVYFMESRFIILQHNQELIIGHQKS